MEAEERRRVVFFGAYGIESAGDDAPLAVLTSGFRRHFPNVDFEFVAIARHPDPLMSQRCGVRFVQNLEYESRGASVGRWFRGMNPGDAREPLERISREIEAAHVIVGGAGNMLIDVAMDLFRGPIPLCAVYAFLADLHRTPLFLYGLSAGPFSTARGRLVSGWIARRAAVVTCRDRASARLLGVLSQRRDVHLLPDPVLGLAPATDRELDDLLRAERIPRVGARPRLAVGLRETAFQGNTWHEPLVAALRELATRYELLFVPQCTYRDSDDRLVARKMIGAIGGNGTTYIIDKRYPPDVLMRVYEMACASLTIRLHAAVFSSVVGTPVVALNYLPKVAGFMSHVGSERFTYNLTGLRPDELVSAVEEAARTDGSALRHRCAALGEETLEYVRLCGAVIGLDG
ncbi:polysaccharide pyruvyl transferase family protein [Planctomycetota bacterium]